MKKPLTKEQLCKKYAEKSKQYRFKNNLSQAQFGELLGIQQSVVSRIEKEHYCPPSYIVDLLNNY
jgi:DNA-binding XRE family transcriptional regulator